MSRACLLSLPACLLLLTRSPAASPITADDAAFFEKQVRPLLIEHCWQCHGEKKQQGGLRLDSRETALEGGVNGPAIVPGKVDESLMIQAVRRSGKLKMPPEKPLPAPAVATLAHWIERGAPWPEAVQIAHPPPHAATRHWAFQPIRKPPLPELRTPNSESRSPIDRFILAKLETQGLTPSPEADRRTLIRRLAFDLIGLPPTPEEVETFENDE